MAEKVTDRDWERFFDALWKITNMPVSGGGWREKRAAVEAEAARRDADGALGEFVSWWQQE